MTDDEPNPSIKTVAGELGAEHGMKRIRFSVIYPERFVHPLHRRLVDETVVTRLELLMWSPTADATTLCWCDGDRAATGALVDAVESVRDRTLVGDDDGTYVVLRQREYEFAGAILAAVADAGVIFLPPVVFRDTGVVQFEAVGEATALSAFHDDLATLGDVSIERVREFERRRSPSTLTDRQRAALEAGLAVGYYEVPRDGTVADVAAELDCAASTAGELLRKAEGAVIAAHVG
ncbi:HTH DNA binding domain-containing protein [Halorientalis regularis]|uniref:HTH DNA binding domain-containing protein n=2 Tax=Halorientalis regularis TaxID=660518 RepID=A0A1G7LXF9_9EURY|nr:HTH DNA binding domain-containing protein [Halorientalis regularis]